MINEKHVLVASFSQINQKQPIFCDRIKSTRLAYITVVKANIFLIYQGFTVMFHRNLSQLSTCFGAVAKW